MITIKDVFIGKARKYKDYQEAERTEGRKCISCIRWRFSYPYTCNDYDMYSAKGETCLNWSDDPKCRVD